MQREHETNMDATPSGRARRRRSLLVASACAAVLLTGPRDSAVAGSVADCSAFHQECADAKAAGYSDPGICHVERLECPADAVDGVRVPKTPREARDEDRVDPERSYGERDIGP